MYNDYFGIFSHKCNIWSLSQVVSVAAFFIMYEWVILAYFPVSLHALQYFFFETEHFRLYAIVAPDICPPQGRLIIFICLVTVCII